MKTVEEIKQAIADYFGDTSRTRSETKSGLEDIVVEAETFIDALRDEDQ